MDGDTSVRWWSGRVVIAIYFIGFISAVVMMVKLAVAKVSEWLQRRGGW